MVHFKSQLVAQQGVYHLDGIEENGNKAGVGIYIAYAEVLDLDGNVKANKKSVVVGSR